MRFKIAALFAVAATTLITSTSGAPADQTKSQPPLSKCYAVVVYGGTSGGVIAAVQAARMGRSVVLVSPREHLGGLTSNGLGMTDTGNTSGIGGLSREFYQRVKSHYDKDSAWQYETPKDYPHYDKDEDTIWRFEPHVAEQVYDRMVSEEEITLLRGAKLDRDDGVITQDGRIQTIETLGGRVIRGKMFIDATYVGDLMAAAGVSYTVGRESNNKYDESYNGVQKDVRHHPHFFSKEISPYVEPGNPDSGLVPRVHGEDPGENGEGDHRVQAYCFRMCMTQVETNKVDWPKPEGYNPEQYELLLRAFEANDFGETATVNEVLKIDMMPNKKTDTNNRGPFSTDNIGKNYSFPEASYKERKEIYKRHERYQKGLMWTLAHHERVPENVRQEMQEWGLAADEFEDNGNWPHMLYIREGRRMIGEYVMTEHDCLRTEETPRPIGLGSYTMDSHNVQRYVTEEGHVQNEGDVGVHPGGPYEIAYGSIVPQKEEIENLLVPVAVSASHIAFGSIRMEPVFMILGQSAGTAASHAISESVPVQEIDYDRLKKRLLKDGQNVETDVPPKHISNIDADDLKGVVVDDDDAKASGNWIPSSSITPYVGNGYRHDDNANKTGKKLVFEAAVKPGKYEVRFAYSSHENRASNVSVEVVHQEGTDIIHVDEKESPEHQDLFTTLGTYQFDGTGRIIVRAPETDGYVVADAVQFISAD